MIINNKYSIKDISNSIENKKLFCFGAGSIGVDFCDFAIYNNISINNIIFVDNFNFGFEKHNIKVISKNDMIEQIEKDDIIVISTLFCSEIYEDLQQYSKLDSINVFFAQILYHNNLQETKELKLTKKSDIPIPKIIHYCWFGGTTIPKDLQQYISTWQEKCPDYTIKRWDESNYDVTKNRYMKEAYDNKKWGFVSDYARLDILYEYGGIYLDTDVEVLKNFDELLYQGAFCSFLADFKVNTGNGIGAVPKHRLIKDMMKEYDNIKFINDNGTLNIVPCMEYQHKTLSKYNYNINGKLQEFDDFAILPLDVLCGYNHYIDKYIVNDNTFAIHHSKRSWQDDDRRKSIDKSMIFLSDILNGKYNII